MPGMRVAWTARNAFLTASQCGHTAIIATLARVVSSLRVTPSCESSSSGGLCSASLGTSIGQAAQYQASWQPGAAFACQGGRLASISSYAPGHVRSFSSLPHGRTVAVASAEAASAEADQDSDTTETLLLTSSSTELTSADIGAYYPLNTSIIPEAFQSSQQAFYAPRSGAARRRGGCLGLQREQVVSGRASLMYRQCMHELRNRLAAAAAGAPGGKGQRLLMRGPAGSGKSIALLSLVEWAREAGWLVLYIPSASALVDGGFFHRRSDGGYDTIISAQQILKGLADVHQKRLAGLPATTAAAKGLLSGIASSSSKGGKGSGKDVAVGEGAGKGSSSSSSSEGLKPAALLDLCMVGMGTDDARLAVDCCLALIQELAATPAQVPVLLAVDDYNCLHGPTGYGQTMAKTTSRGPTSYYRRPLAVEELNLASKLRLLERKDLPGVHVAVATSSSRSLPEAAEKAAAGYALNCYVPRFSFPETAHALYYYHQCGLLKAAPSADEVETLKGLTNGNAEELRQWCVGTTQVHYMP